jgi:hypothetical protein
MPSVTIRCAEAKEAPLDLLVYTPEEFARYQSVPGSFTHTVAHEGKILYARPGE